jgi:hypothetical protein
MVCAATLRASLVLPEREAEVADSYKFDRRRGPRRFAPGWLSATYGDGDGHFGVASVQLIDAGPAGLGMRTRAHLQPGMSVSLHPPGARFASLTATVVRCTPDEDGYTIGLSTLPVRAA